VRRVARLISVPRRPPRGRIVDLVLRSKFEKVRKVSLALLFGGYGQGRAARALFVDALVAVHEEGLVPAVVFGQPHGAAGRRAPPIVSKVAARDVITVREEEVGRQFRGHLDVVGRAVKGVGSRFETHVDDAALGLADGGVERRGLHLELADQVGGRNPGRDEFVSGPGVSRGAVYRAVQHHIAAVRAGSIHGVSHDVSRLERAVQGEAHGEGDPGRQLDEVVGVTVRNRQFGHPAGVHHRAHGSAGGFQQRRFRHHRYLFCNLAYLQGEIDLEPVVDAQFKAVLNHTLEPGGLGFDAVGAGDQVRQQVVALSVGHRGYGDAGCDVGGFDRSIGNYGPCGIQHAAQNGAARLLAHEGANHQDGEDRQAET